MTDVKAPICSKTYAVEAQLENIEPHPGTRIDTFITTAEPPQDHDMEPTSTSNKGSSDTHVWHRRHAHDHRGSDSSSSGTDELTPETTQSSSAYEDDTADTKTLDDDEPQNTVTRISEKPLTEPPYHVFTRKEKWALVYIVSLAGLFSPLSSNIYFPALGAIADVRDALC